MLFPSLSRFKIGLEHGLVRVAASFLICVVAALGIGLDTYPYDTELYFFTFMSGQYLNFIREALSLWVMTLPWMLLAQRFLGGLVVGIFALSLWAFVNHLKLQHLNAPLSSVDFYCLVNYEVLRQYGERVFLPLMFGIAGAVFFLALAAPRRTQGWASFLNFGAVPFPGKIWVKGVLVFSLLWTWSLLNERFLLRPVIERFMNLPTTMSWSEKGFASQNGVMTMFLFGFGSKKLQRPENLTLQTTNEAIALAEQKSFSNGNSRSTVLLLVESLIDVNNLQIQLSSDPTPHLHSLQAQKMSFLAEVPTVFGKTANTEFELLTGVSLYSLPPDSIPFLNHIERETHSIARTFAQNGYETIALHNFYSHSWRRYFVWPLLGFETTAFLEKNYPRKKLGWPDDKILFDQILQRLQGSTSPQFIFAVTASTHGPYSANTADAEPIRILGQPLEPAELAEAELYLTQLRRVDRQIADLIKQLDQLGVDYLILGDHLPPAFSEISPLALPEKTLGALISEYDQPSKAAGYFTPGIISVAGQKELPSTHISSRCLGSLLLSAKGLALNPVDQYAASSCYKAGYLSHSPWRKKQNPDFKTDSNMAYDFFKNRLGLPQVLPSGTKKSYLMSWRPYDPDSPEFASARVTKRKLLQKNAGM